MDETHRVLIVDDDKEILRGLSVRLNAQGYEIFTAPDGEAGLTLAKNIQPNAIVLDINMPVMDGFTMLNRLRESEETKNIPVVMLSANASERIRNRALNRGARYFIEKPYEPQKLVSALRSAIDELIPI